MSDGTMIHRADAIRRLPKNSSSHFRVRNELLTMESLRLQISDSDDDLYPLDDGFYLLPIYRASLI